MPEPAALILLRALVILLCLSHQPAQAVLVAEFKLDEGVMTSDTNTIYSSDGAFSGIFAGSSPLPLWITNYDGLPQLLLAQTNTMAAISNSAAGGHVTTHFYGTNDLGNSIIGTNARTICAWVQTTRLPDSAALGYIVSYGSISMIVGGRFSLRLDTTAGFVGQLRCEVSTGSVTGTNTIICDGNWHHVAVVSPAGARVTNLLLYVDGNLQQLGNIGSPGTLVNTAPVNPVYIGGYTPLSAKTSFIGAIDDVQLYDEALTAGQIAGLVYGPGNPPAIVGQPMAQTVNLGVTNGTATYTVAVSGSPPIQYQWKKNGLHLPGATNQILVINPVTVSDLAAYSVGITNAYGSTNSDAATLAWDTPAVDPPEEATLIGGNAVFAITMPADSTGYTYQWREGGVPVLDATNQSYALAGATLANATNFSVAVMLGNQSATSGPAVLHVLSPPASPYAQLVLADGPEAYWRLGETNGASAATDLAAFHHGQYMNYSGYELEQAGAPIGDGDTSSTLTGGNWVDVPYSPALQHIGGFTVEAWVNPASNFGLQEIVDACNDSFFTHGYELAINGPYWLFRTGNSISPAIPVYTDLNAGSVAPGVWQHVVATYDGVTKRLYVNGALVGTQVSTILPTPVPVRIGAGLPTEAVPKNFFNGVLDEVAIYGHALSPIQIANHYLMGLVGPGTVAPSLLRLDWNPEPVLSWDGAWVLQSTDTLDDPNQWQDISATSPYTVPQPLATQQYFRLRSP